MRYHRYIIKIKGTSTLFISDYGNIYRVWLPTNDRRTIFNVSSSILCALNIITIFLEGDHMCKSITVNYPSLFKVGSRGKIVAWSSYLTLYVSAFFNLRDFFFWFLKFKWGEMKFSSGNVWWYSCYRSMFFLVYLYYL